MNFAKPNATSFSWSWLGSGLTLTSLCLLLTLSLACNHAVKKVRPLEPAPTCTLPSGVNLAEALSQARSDLKLPDCQLMFDEYFQALLNIAAGDPTPENKRLFSEFLVWTNETGIMTRVQAEDYYNRHFNDTFMSLPDRYNLCSACPQKGELLRDMKQELRQKEQGLLEACRDKETYYQASRSYAELRDIIEATCLACGQE